MAWSQQISILQDILLILLNIVIYLVRHIGMRFLDLFVNYLDTLPPRHSHHSSISSFDSSRTNNGLHYNYAGHPSQLLHYPSSRTNSHQADPRSVQLFDPENPQRPNPSLMTHYINVFFEQHGSEFPFLSYQDISTDFWDQRLSSILANCIAAMGSQYVTRQSSNGRHLTKDKTLQSSRVIHSRPPQCLRKLH